MHTRYLVILLVLLLAVGALPAGHPTPAQAAGPTDVGGTLTGTHTWTSANSPYRVTSDVTLEAGATLTIQPGTVIEFDLGTRLTVAGELRARGSADQPIRFTADRTGLPDHVPSYHIEFESTGTDAAFDDAGAYTSGNILEHVIVEHASGDLNGAAIDIDQANVYIAHSRIDSGVKNGINAALGEIGGQTVRIHDTTIQDCLGTAINLTSSDIGTVVLTDNTITGNRSGIRIINGRTVQISNSIFRNNRSGKYGGIRIWDTRDVVILGNELTGHTHGAIAIETGVRSLLIQDNLISDNTTGDRGGGIHVHVPRSTTIMSNTIRNNTARLEGGGINFQGDNGTTVFIAGNTIENNDSGRAGGGINMGYVLTDSGGARILNNTLQGNSANASGGGLQISNGFGDGVPVEISGNTFAENSSSGSGGGLFLQLANDISGNEIISNTAGIDAAAVADGGGLFLQGGTPLVSGNTIAGNRLAGTSRRGGGLFIGQNAAPVLKDNNIVDNSPDNSTTLGSNIYTERLSNSAPIDAQQNWWGTTSSSVIESSIWHNPDDGALGQVIYEPYRSQPVTLLLAGISPNRAVANAGNLPIVITGTQFGEEISARIGDVELLDVQRASNSIVYAVVPVDEVGIGVHDVTLVSDGTELRLTEAFTVGGAQVATQFRSLVIMGCDNNLEPTCERAFNQLELAMSNNPDLRIVVLWDGNGDGDSAYYLIQPDSNLEQRAEYREGESYFPQGELDTGKPSTLVEFIGWAQARYPGTFSFISFLGHGSGWAAQLSPGQPRGRSSKSSDELLGGILWDDHPASTLNTRGLAEVLRYATPNHNDGERQGVIYLDACLMGSVEVVTEIGPFADYLVVHPNLTWAVHPYGEYLGSVNSSTTPETLARHIASTKIDKLPRTGHPDYVAVIDTRALDTLLSRLDTLAGALRDDSGEVLPTARTTLTEVLPDIQRLDQNYDLRLNAQDNFIDLRDLLMHLSTNTTLPRAATAAAEQAMGALEQVVIFTDEQSGTPWLSEHNEEWRLNQLSGLSIYFPVSDEWQRGFYNGDSLPTFAEATQWTALVQAWHGNNPGLPQPTEECLGDECLTPPLGVRPGSDTSGSSIYLPLIAR